MSDYEEKEIPEILEKRLELIDERRDEAGDGPILSDGLRYLWNNPDVYEEKGAIPMLKDEYDTDELSESMMFVLLGILFGTEYEHAFPREVRE